MHPSVMAWFAGGALSRDEVAGRRVLEVGAYNVNGSVRPLVEALEPSSYLGVDQTAGPGVDQVMVGEQLAVVLRDDSFDIVISTEMLEHAECWQSCLANMVAVLRPGGLLVLTTRAPGFPRHEFPSDCWRFTVPLMKRIVDVLGLEVRDLTPDADPASPGVFLKAYKPTSWLRSWDLEGLLELQAEPAPLR